MEVANTYGMIRPCQSPRQCVRYLPLLQTALFGPSFTIPFRLAEILMKSSKLFLPCRKRLRTVAGGDKIVVLSDGMVAEEGDPDQLLQQNGIYTHMVKLQTDQNWTLA